MSGFPDLLDLLDSKTELKNSLLMYRQLYVQLRLAAETSDKVQRDALIDSAQATIPAASGLFTDGYQKLVNAQIAVNLPPNVFPRPSRAATPTAAPPTTAPASPEPSASASASPEPSGSAGGNGKGEAATATGAAARRARRRRRPRPGRAGRPMGSRIVVLVNPTSGRGRSGKLLPKVRQAIQSRGLDAEVRLSSRPRTPPASRRSVPRPASRSWPRWAATGCAAWSGRRWSAPTPPSA